MIFKKIVSFIGVILLIGFAAYPVCALSDNTLDTRARNLSYESGQSIESIVQNLTKGLKSDRDKAYVLAAFIAYQFQRNGFAQRELEKASYQNKRADTPLPNNILKTRIGTPQEFATLYQSLCQAAGLKSTIIKGYASKNLQSPDKNTSAGVQAVRNTMKQLTNQQDYRMQQYEASWNAVELDGKWALVDTYWMIGGILKTGNEIKNQKEMERFLSRRERNGLRNNELTRGKSIDTSYFDANPRQFIKTHYPLDNKWQLINPPVSWRSFAK